MAYDWVKNPRPNLMVLHQRVREACRLDACYQLIDRYDIEFLDEGGCLMLAHALRRILGQGKIVAIMGYNPQCADWSLVPQHYLLQLGGPVSGNLVDWDGVYSMQHHVGKLALEHRVVCHHVEVFPSLKAARAAIWEDSVPYYPKMVRELEALLRPHILDKEQQ